MREWVVVGIVFAALFFLIPAVWERLEAFEPGPAYRIPYALSNDYWHFARYCRRAAERDCTLVIGDSVVWGEYVTPERTLSQHLNRLTGNGRFINVGVNGIHPVAMAGLIAHYGRAISGKDVLLHYNPLWMSSPRHDLQTEKEFRFNHPKLVPQFLPRIPCYKDPYAERLGIVAERYLPLRAWSNHLAQAYFDNIHMPAWAVERPYDNPLRSVTLDLPAPDQSERHGPAAPWTERGMSEQRFEWVEPATSFQWRFFQRAAKTLARRGNNLFVLVGPFNEHMIAPESLEAYEDIKGEIETWLREQQIPHLVARLLPSELYADASHPSSEGYGALAEQLLDNQAFRKFRALQEHDNRTKVAVSALKS